MPRRTGSTKPITAYHLPDVHPKSGTLPASVWVHRTPGVPKQDQKHLKQGWAVHGDYLYTLEGRAKKQYEDTFLRCYDLTTETATTPAKQTQKCHVTLAEGWSFHEPEGIAIRNTATPQLQFCISSQVGARHPSHLYYVEKTEPVPTA